MRHWVPPRRFLGRRAHEAISSQESGSSAFFVFLSMSISSAHLELMYPLLVAASEGVTDPH